MTDSPARNSNATPTTNRRKLYIWIGAALAVVIVAAVALVWPRDSAPAAVKPTATFLAEAGQRVAPCGNIGVPVLDAIRDPQGWDVLVVELSSYQLHHVKRDGIGSLEPLASVCLNIADDHLDWHGSAEAYRAAKSTVYANTLVACVYNKADAATEAMVRDADVADGARAIGFDLGSPGPSDFGIVDGILCDRAFLDDRHHTAIELTTITELAARWPGHSASRQK